MMDSWESFNMQWQDMDDGRDYVKLRVTNTRKPHRQLEQLVNKVKKPDIARNQDLVNPDASNFCRQMTSRIGKYIETFFRQKVPVVYITNKFFTVGLIHTKDKCNVIVNMTGRTPLYVYLCDPEEKDRYISKCNKHDVLVNKSNIENHFELREITTSYLIPPDSVYFLFTVSPSVFLRESFVPPFDVPLSNVVHITKQIEPSAPKSTKKRNSVGNNNKTFARQHSAQASTSVRQDNQQEGADETRGIQDANSHPPKSQDELTRFLDQKKMQVLQALEDERHGVIQYLQKVNDEKKSIRESVEEAIKEATNGKELELGNLRDTMQEEKEYYEGIWAEKDKEISALESQKETETHTHESEIQVLTNKLNSETERRVELESEIQILTDELSSETKRKSELESESSTVENSLTEVFQELSVSMESLEKENTELKQKIRHFLEGLKL